MDLHLDMGTGHGLDGYGSTRVESRRTWASRGRGGGREEDERQRQEAHPPSADQRPSLQSKPDYYEHVPALRTVPDT